MHHKIVGYLIWFTVNSRSIPMAELTPTPQVTTPAGVSRVDMANAIRALTMDAVQAANSGHPGAPMGMADMAVALWGSHLKHNPGNPKWFDRDRFVLSNGHGSMLLYSVLHLTGYKLPINPLQQSKVYVSKHKISK